MSQTSFFCHECEKQIHEIVYYLIGTNQNPHSLFCFCSEQCRNKIKEAHMENPGL